MKNRLSGFKIFFNLIASCLHEHYQRFQDRKLNHWEKEKRQIIRTNKTIKINKYEKI